MESITVLITAAGNVFMPGTIACLKKNGERDIRVIGADMSDDATILKMCDAAYQVPRATDPAYAETLLRICRQEKVDVLLPVMSAELETLANNRSEFEKLGTRVSVSAPEALRIANNKRRLLSFLHEMGFPCAEYRSVSSIGELETAAAELGYPAAKVCVKAEESSGSRGFRILSSDDARYERFLYEKPSAGITTLQELVEILMEAPEFPKLLAMEYLPGTEYSVDLLADRGEVLYCCCRKSLRMENSIMLDAEIVDEPAVNELCSRVTKALELDGNIGFDLKERQDGTPLIMECNPRITAGVPFFEAAGVNLPYLCVKKLLGEALPDVKPAYGTIVKRRWMEMAV